MPKYSFTILRFLLSSPNLNTGHPPLLSEQDSTWSECEPVQCQCMGSPSVSVRLYLERWDTGVQATSLMHTRPGQGRWGESSFLCRCDPTLVCQRLIHKKKKHLLWLHQELPQCTDKWPDGFTKNTINKSRGKFSDAVSANLNMQLETQNRNRNVEAFNSWLGP